mgnify:CR=1 FL=1
MKDEDIKHIIKLLDFSYGKYDVKKVFYDVIMLQTYFINIFMIGRTELSDEFDKTMEHYSPEEQKHIWEIMYELSMLYKRQEEANDILGEIYNRLQIHNKQLGQFFTPTHISGFIAKANGINENDIEEFGYIPVCEPCCRCWWNDISLC